jgi:hypothetical protein
MTIADESRTFTAADFEEIRPGVLKLRDRDVYVVRHGAVEPCEGCGGAGKVASVARSGRKSWRKCTPCKGRGECDPMWNLQRGRGRFAITHDVDLERIVLRLNSPTAGLVDDLYKCLIIGLLR